MIKLYHLLISSESRFNIDIMRLSRQLVNRITPSQVHPIVKKNVLANGFDLVFDLNKSKGNYVVDALNQKKYLDMFGFYASCPVGHNHPKMTDKNFIKELGKIAIHNPSNSNIYTIEYAKFLATMQRICMPKGFEHLFLIAGGTLAVESALKTAFDWKVRRNMRDGKGAKGSQVIHFKDAFHGRSGYSLSLTNTDPAKYLHFPLFDWPRIINPAIKFPLNQENLRKVVEKEQIALNHITSILDNEGDDIACIILEPIQGEGGDHHFRPEFWKKLRQLADKYHVLLIADEVQSGMGITGKLWAYEHLGAEPDIIVFGKKLQVCGIMCNQRINEIKDNVFAIPSRLNSTWGGNLVDMVRSRKYMEIIEEENLINNAKVVGNYCLNHFYELQLQYPNLIFNVRGKGLMIAFDLPNKELCEKLKQIAYHKGLLIISSGDRTIRLRPMLDIKKKDIDRLVEILNDCLTKIE